MIGAAVLPYVWMLLGALAIAMMGTFGHGLASSCPWQIVAADRPLATSRFDGVSIAMLVGVGVFATIGQLFLTKAFAAGPPAKVSVVALAQAVFAALFDVVIWDHSFSAVTLVGMALVMLPSVWLLARGPVLARGDA